MKRSVYQTLLLSGILILSLAVSSFSLQQFIGKKEMKNKIEKTSQEGFAVLELFTSQGCSSCPPADDVLAQYVLQNNPRIIPLSFHVDYWNYIGWKDPFSKAQFTDRQYNYTKQLKSQGNYTPQMVINGKHELIGSYKNQIDRLVNQEMVLKPKFQLSINKAAISNNEVKVEFNSDAVPNSVVNLALVKKKEFTSIKRGENSGLKQTNYNIVFDFKSIPNTQLLNNTTSFRYQSDWLASDFFLIAYIQNTKTGQIMNVTKSLIN